MTDPAPSGMTCTFVLWPVVGQGHRIALGQEMGNTRIRDGPGEGLLAGAVAGRFEGAGDLVEAILEQVPVDVHVQRGVAVAEHDPLDAPPGPFLEDPLLILTL